MLKTIRNIPGINAYKNEPHIVIDENGVAWQYVGYSTGIGAGRAVDIKQLPVVVKDFQCPICSNTEYETHYAPTPLSYGTGIIGSKTEEISNYSCKRCSVRFDDPELFSKDQEASVVEYVEGPAKPPATTS